MSDTNNLFIRGMFNFAVAFLANPDMQRRSWSATQGNDFQDFLMMALGEWSVVEKNPKGYLSDRHFAMTSKLYAMLEEFYDSEKWPTRPAEYQALLGSPEWRKVQEHAKEVYGTVYPTLR